MAIPRQVQQEQERIEAMMRGLSGEDTGAEEGAAETQGDETEAPAADNVAHLNPGAQEAENEQQPADESTDAQEDLQPSAQDNSGDVSQQLRDLQRQLNEVQQASQQKDQTIQQLQALMASMQQAPEQQQQEPQQPEQNKVPSQDEAQDRAEFGDDFVDMVIRVLDRRLSGIEERLNRTEQAAEQTVRTQTEDRQEKFYRQLDERVPDWRQIDNSAHFTNWLKQSKTRIAIVKQAMANFDVDGIVEVFEFYKATNGLGQTSNTESAPSEEKSKPAKPSLKNKVSPSKGRTGNTATSTSEPKEWTRSEIAQVYSNRRQYTQKQFDELQREIFAAQKEGRVDYSK